MSVIISRVEDDKVRAGHFYRLHRDGHAVGYINMNSTGEWILCLDGVFYYFNTEAEALTRSQK